jgi:hypothetical protein
VYGDEAERTERAHEAAADDQKAAVVAIDGPAQHRHRCHGSDHGARRNVADLVRPRAELRRQILGKQEEDREAEAEARLHHQDEQESRREQALRLRRCQRRLRCARRVFQSLCLGQFESSAG